MKKRSVIALLAFLPALAGLSQSASFTAPMAGATLVMGQAQLIAWSGSGSASIKLVLVSKNDGMQWNLKSGLAISAGAWSWTVGSLENSKTVPAGNNYLVRMQNMAGGEIIAKTGLFSIAGPATPPTPATAAKGTMHRPAETLLGLHPKFKEMALAAMPPPDSTSFRIAEVKYEFESEGKLAYIAVLIEADSPKEFMITSDYGDPQFGAQWVQCKIENPAYLGSTGDGCSPLAFSGTFSVKGGGNSQPFSTYPAAALPAGPSNYVLVFKPLCNGLVKGIGLFQKMPSGIFQPGKLCKHEFYPKIRISFTACRAQVKFYGTWTSYLFYDTNRWPLKWFSLPGEISECLPGWQPW